MTVNNLAYALRIGASEESNLPRVFGRVAASIENTRMEIKTLQGTQRDLNAELRRTERGTDAYRDLERQIVDTRGRITRLTSDLNDQEQSWRRINRVSDIAGRTFISGAAALTAATAGFVLAVENTGQASQELLALQRETGISIEYLQQLQNLARAVGTELDVDEFRELNIRLGEAQTGTGIAADAFRALGIDLALATSENLPFLLDRLAELNREQRQFYADELFGGTLAERLIPTLDLPPEQRAAILSVTTLTQEQAEEFALARVQLQALKQEFGASAAALAAGFLPILTEVNDTVTPIARTFAEWASNNPELVLTLGGVIAGITATAGAVWALNSALAVRAALSGPAGWAALAVAAGLGIAGFVIGGQVAGSISDSQSSIGQVQDDLRTIPVRVGEEVESGVGKVVDRQADMLEGELENILPSARCAARDEVADVIEYGFGQLEPRIAEELNASRQAAEDRIRELDRAQPTGGGRVVTDAQLMSLSDDEASLLNVASENLVAAGGRGLVPPSDNVFEHDLQVAPLSEAEILAALRGDPPPAPIGSSNTYNVEFNQENHIQTTEVVPEVVRGLEDMERLAIEANSGGTR